VTGFTYFISVGGRDATYDVTDVVVRRRYREVVRGPTKHRVVIVDVLYGHVKFGRGRAYGLAHVITDHQ